MKTVNFSKKVRSNLKRLLKNYCYPEKNTHLIFPYFAPMFLRKCAKKNTDHSFMTKMFKEKQQHFLK